MLWLYGTFLGIFCSFTEGGGAGTLLDGACLIRAVIGRGVDGSGILVLCICSSWGRRC